MTESSPLDALAQSSAAIQALEAVVAHQARECRRAGYSWSAIARAAGVSKVTALNKWKEPDMTNTNTTTLTTDPAEWTLAPGDTVRRRDLHAQYGGNIQSGISPSRSSNNVLLFASPRGADHGYADGPDPDGTYTYSGEGQRGDQEMTRGNKAIRDHEANGKSLRLFEGDGSGVVTYVGEFAYDTHRTMTIPGTGASGQRQGIVFTLRPTGRG